MAALNQAGYFSLFVIFYICQCRICQSLLFLGSDINRECGIVVSPIAVNLHTLVLNLTKFKEALVTTSVSGTV
jgi:hypothetical protein